MRRTRTTSSLLAGLSAAVLAGSLCSVAVAADHHPTPSRQDVQHARQDVERGERDVAQVRQELALAQDRLHRAGEAADAASEAFNGARWRYQIGRAHV